MVFSVMVSSSILLGVWWRSLAMTDTSRRQNTGHLTSILLTWWTTGTVWTTVTVTSTLKEPSVPESVCMTPIANAPGASCFKVRKQHTEAIRCRAGWRCVTEGGVDLEGCILVPTPALSLLSGCHRLSSFCSAMLFLPWSM